MTTRPTLEELREALKVPEVKHKTDRLGRRRSYQIERHKIDHAFNRNPRKGLKQKWMWI